MSEAKWFMSPKERILSGERESVLMHELFQRHGLTPSDLHSLGKLEREFLFASMEVKLEEELRCN